ncbi:MAG: hypothetical protein WB780_07390 [Candidatus Acidiferrales bacterium]
MILSLHPFPVRAQSAPNATWSVAIVLPPKVVAGHPATLAVFGADGRLASGVTVETGRNQRVTTDATGRASFTATSDGSFLLAKSSGASSAALVDAAPSVEASRAITVDPVISLKDRFSICGGGFRGDADANRVKINGERALILAASPECLVALPGPKASPGPAIITVQTADIQRTAAATLVSLEFDPPQPALEPGKKSNLVVRVKGVQEALRLVVENQTPGVLRFVRGDSQEMRTSGGENNVAQVEVQAIRSGDFSFHARLVSSPDPAIAQRYLRAAEPLAPKDLQHRLRDAVERLERHPKDTEKIQRQLAQIISTTIGGDLRTLLEAAAAAL